MIFERIRFSIIYIIFIAFAIAISGCAVGIYKASPADKAKIVELQDELEQLRGAKSMLEDKLRQEIGDSRVKLEMAERGLVITFVAEVLFDSGKAQLKSEGKSLLDKVCQVLQQEAIENEIGVEGHTDNIPIKYSGYKSNWELSTARATEVLHYLVDKAGLDPKKLSATGYGQYRPVMSNDTAEGRQKNRRVEIIIKPQTTKAAAKRSAQRPSYQSSSESYIK